MPQNNRGLPSSYAHCYLISRRWCPSEVWCLFEHDFMCSLWRKKARLWTGVERFEYFMLPWQKVTCNIHSSITIKGKSNKILGNIKRIFRPHEWIKLGEGGDRSTDSWLLNTGPTFLGFNYKVGCDLGENVPIHVLSRGVKNLCTHLWPFLSTAAPFRFSTKRLLVHLGGGKSYWIKVGYTWIWVKF